MELCYVSFEYPPQFGGGIGTYVGNISRNLANSGHEVHVITFNPGGLKEVETIDRVIIHRISMDGPQMEIINNASSPNLSTLLYWSLYSEKVFRKLQDLTKIHSFAAIEFCDYRGEGYFTLLAKKLRGEFADIPLVVRLHTPLFVLNKYNNAENEPGMQQLVNYENLTMLLADHIVSPTQILADITQDELKVDAIDVLPHPIDIELMPNGSYKESEKFLYVGRLEHRKGVVDLINAMVNFMPRYPNATMKLIGGDTRTGPNGSSMKQYLQSLIPDQLSTRFEFVDRLPREEVLKEYLTVRGCIFPSLFENFPNVCLEAMSLGSPVIVSHYSGMAEMIENHVSGIIFESGNISDLEKKVEQLYNTSFDDRKAMGESAKKRVQSAYTKDVINELQSSYFKKIAKNRSDLKSYKGPYQSGLVSIIIPCYNHGQFLDETISSVYSNTYKDVEIIIVNDGSTDPETITVLDKISGPNLKVIHQQNSGLSAARNTGVSHARGEYILPLDADDIIEPTFLQKTVEVLEANPNVGFVYTHVKFFGAADGVWKTPEFDPNLLLISNLCVATSLYRHIAFDQIDGYKTDMIYGFEDWDFWIYMVEKGWSGKCLAEPLFLYRKHQESMLSGSQKNRPFLMQKIIEHHYESYQKALTYVLVEKDKMFFQEHMSSYLNYRELNSITNSKAWKFILYYRKIKDRVKKLLGGSR